MSKIKTNLTVKKLLLKHRSSVKLNVGCGTDYKNGWINIDNNSDNNIKRLDLNWDLRNLLPFPNNSVDFIFHEHFIEHLTVKEGQRAIRDLLRVLKPGGIMRIATPDLKAAVDKYLNLPLEEDPTIKTFKMDFVETRAERINMAFRWWGHEWLYDREELVRRLVEAGCEKRNIEQQQLHISSHKELEDLETREESTLIVEVTK